MLLNAISYLLGNCIILLLSELPRANTVYSITIIVAMGCGVTLIAASSRIHIIISRVMRVAIIAAIAFSWAFYQASAHQKSILPYELEKKPITIFGYIASFPKIKSEASKFNFMVQGVQNENKTAYKGVDLKKLNLGIIKLSWQTDLKLEIGQQWQLTVRLKRPRGLANPGSFDVEKQSFQQRITAVGYVDRKSTANININTSTNASTGSIRNWIYTRIIAAIGKKEFIGTILALTLGMQQEVTRQHWQVFQQTGVAHLLAISGLHIGFVAGIAYAFAAMLWRRMPISWLKFPALQVGAFAALIAAYGYAFLAGFSVSAKRSLLMIAVAMLAVLCKRKINAVIGFSWALIIVLVLDPLAILAASFWLSFVAVAILLYTFTGRKKQTGVLVWLKPQIVLTVGLLPLGIGYFGNLVLIAPLANLIVIPYVNFLVVPLALLGIVIIPILPGLAEICWITAEWLFAAIWPMLIKMQAMPWASLPIAAPTYWQLILSSIGIIWLLAPRGFPGKMFGWCGVLVLFALSPQQKSMHSSKSGAIKITMLDVGQGLSVVLVTENHVLLYDTGPKFSDNSNAGEMVIWPYLRSQGIRQLDKVIVSHADLDHAGGIDSLVQYIVPKQILTPDPAELKNANLANMLPCRAGQHWEWDGVQFEILHPSLPLSKKRNDQSCVLKVSSDRHSILFTGDISTIVEKQLLANYAARLSAEILMIPHHGSASSSDIAFITQVAPNYALASVGYLNRYGHPKPQVVNSYEEHGSMVLDTALFGAIDLQFDDKSKNLGINCYRIDQRKFWND